MLQKAFSIVRTMGVKNFVKKVSIYLYRKSGVQRLSYRQYSYDQDLYPKFGNLGWEWEEVPLLSERNIKNASDYLHTLSTDIKEKLKKKAEEIESGYYTLFSYHKVYQENIDFNLDPLDNVRWIEKKHSSLFSQFDPAFGDIKRVWELNRFMFANLLVPAYHLETDPKRKQYLRNKFLYLLESWLLQNPCERTVSWGCSQEISIRCINLIFMFRQLECSVNGESTSKFKNMLALSVRHVYKEIEYAKSQRNNHAITESVFLILFSSVFPLSKMSAKYYKKGIETLLFCLDDQFFLDGTYIQNSLTYQRFALQSMILVESLIKEKSVRLKIVGLFEKNLIFLSNITFGLNGDFPNYGPNDGAMLFNWSGVDYRDMRPLLNLLSLKVKGLPMFTDPELLIDAAFLIEGFKFAIEKKFIPEKKMCFDESGYYIMKNESFSIFFRCGSYDNRFPSQNDMLHLDVWANGKSVLNDSGSFEYYGISGLRNFHYFLSTNAHNTIKIGNLDQLDKGPRFTWLSSIRAKLIYWSESKISGESYAYHHRLKGNPIHRRTIEIFFDQIVVTDELINLQDHPIELFWHTTDENISVANGNFFYLDKHNITISFESETSFVVNIIDTPYSQYYAEKKMRKSFHLVTNEKHYPVEIKTIVHLN